jgi:probable rRNA maturation factor
MRALNLQYRGIDRTTDVLSFPQVDQSIKLSILSKSEHVVLGDIVINLHKAKRQAEKHGISFQQEMKKLLVHGLIHLIGYDHEENNSQSRKMKNQENKLLKYL